MTTIRTDDRRLRLPVVAISLTVFLALLGCRAEEPDPPMLSMPDLVGQTVSDALAETYDVLHTSLVTFDLAPADRPSDQDWVIVGTSPTAGSSTPMYTRVYAWALKATEYRWFLENPTMPRIPALTEAARLLDKGGLLAPVRDLVQLRYQLGSAPATARTSPVDAAAFTPDRGMRPDLAAEPVAEWQARVGLREAPAEGTVVAQSLPRAGQPLRDGQYLVVLVEPRPDVRRTPAPSPPRSSAAAPPPSGGAAARPPGGTRGGLPQSFPTAIPTKIPGCPRRLCG